MQLNANNIFYEKKKDDTFLNAKYNNNNKNSNFKLK